MRFTLALFMPQFRRRLKDASWQRWRKRAIVDLGTESKLNEAGISVVDANEFVDAQDRHLFPPHWMTLNNPDPIFPEPPQFDMSHPDWHDTPRRIFDSDSFPIEGVKQAQAFTKSVQIKQGLPDTLLEKSHFIKFPDQDKLAQRVVKQAFLWDAYLEKLPNLRHLDYPSYEFRLQYGTPAKRSNEILVRNFLRLIETEVPEAMVTTRALSCEEEFRINFERHNEPVQFQLSPIANILSKRPLSPVLKQGVVTKSTENVEVPNIFPFLSTANIEDANIYKEEDHYAFKPDSPFPYIHTAIFSHHIPGSHTHIHPRWNDNRFSGTTIMHSFAVALLMARRMYGQDVKNLPDPVTSQVVHVTGKEFQFAVFQLNTLDLDESSQSTIKNVVWLTEKMSLFSKIENQLGKEIFEGYNPNVFKTLLGMYCSATS